VPLVLAGPPLRDVIELGVVGLRLGGVFGQSVVFGDQSTALYLFDGVAVLLEGQLLLGVFVG
jgi:hypothetical protein